MGTDGLVGATQLSWTSYDAAWPVPVNAMEADPADVFVVRVTAPVADPDVVGSNSTSIVALDPGFSVRGKLNPVIPNPLPCTVPLLIVSAAVPDDVRITDCVADVFSDTSPNATVDDPTVSAGVAAPSEIA